jgi:hypothetical protein
MKEWITLCNPIKYDYFKADLRLLIKSANAEYFLKLRLEGSRRAIVQLILLPLQCEADAWGLLPLWPHAFVGTVASDVCL